MKEFKGTPGPWHVSNEGCMLIRDDAGLSIVAKYVGYTSDEEELMNANLIAAAPELLEALRGLLVLYESDEGCRQLAEYTSAHAAINKALGETK